MTAARSSEYRLDDQRRPNLERPDVSMKAGAQVAGQRPTDSTPADADLVRRTLHGERKAFDELVERYQRRAVAVAYRLLGDLEDALEVVQDSFVRAYRKLPDLEDHRRFGSWLLRIVTNLSLNYRRARGPRLSFEDCLRRGNRCQPDEETQSPADCLPDSPHADTQPGAALAAEELETRIQAGLTTLPPQQRAALVLFSVEQLPQKDVADILNCSVEAVKWHVFEARRKMKDYLADYL